MRNPLYYIQNQYCRKEKITSQFILFFNTQIRPLTTSSNNKQMSVFRIQRKRLESESKNKVHSQESKSHSKNVKNLTDLLNSVREKQESHLQIKRRIFTLEENQQDVNIGKLKRISETYNIKTNRKDSMRNSKISKNSLSGTKFFPVFSPGKNSDTKFHPYHGIVRSSPKLDSKLSGKLRSQQKTNMSEQQISLQKKKYRGKNQYISLNSSIVGGRSKNKLVQSNRIVSEEKRRQLKQFYDEAMEYYKKKNSQKAFMLLKECLKYDSQNVDCLYYMGSCCLNMQNYQQSIKYLSQAKNLNPSYSKNLYLYLAISHKKVKNQDQALKVLQFGVKNFPVFEEGYLYIGKIYMRQAQYDEAIQALEKCIELDCANFIAKIMLADACCLANQQLRAIQNLKQVLVEEPHNTLDLKTQISTHLKLIKLLLNLQKYQDPSLSISFSFLQDHTPTSPQLAYYKSLLKYENSLEMTPKQLSQMKINLYFSLNQLQTYQMIIECTKLLLKIYIDNKDFYGAEETLKRITHSEVKAQHIKEWALVIQGANDIIKRKNDQGKQKILKCIKKINSNKNKKILFPILQLSSKDIRYLKLYAYSFLAYSLYLEQNLAQSLSVYEQILNNSPEKTYRSGKAKTFDEKFIKRYEHIFKQIQLNKIVIQAIVDHKVKHNFHQAKRGFQILIQKRVAPECIFMWSINQISLLKKAQTDFGNQNQDSQSQNSQFIGNKKVYEGLDWQNLFQKLNKAENISPNYSLIYFYHSLILLYLENNTQALKKVQTAIQKVQEPVSQYHFIEALCHYTIFEQTKDIESAFRGVQAIDKAIQIDSSIPEFYKERSKHFFCLGKYKESIKDCEKCQELGSDDEVKLLCMFYYYCACNYERSEALLHELTCSGGQNEQKKNENPGKGSNDKKSQNCLEEQSQLSQNEHKYKEFGQAVKFRVKKYGQTGFLGNLLISCTSESCQKLDKMYLKLIKDAIQDRHHYSQFTVYFMNLLMACYYIQQNDFTTSINYLFACLQEIQCILDQKQQKMNENDDNHSQDQSIPPINVKNDDQIVQMNTDYMLNEIKYNIMVATLVKNRHERMIRVDNCLRQNGKEEIGNKMNAIEIGNKIDAKEIYNESLTLIETFMRESRCEQLIQNLEVMKSLILKSQSIPKSQQKFQRKLPRQTGSIPVYLKPYPQTKKFSDEIPYLLIPIGDKYVLMTKFVIFYPIKLKFNIKPEFDPSFLFNFDIDKVDNKITPPWYKFSQTQSQGQFQNRIIFTDQLRNQSITISSTQRAPSILEHPRNSKFNRYEKIGGNDSERKIQKIKSICQDKQVDFKQMIKLDSKIQKKLKKLLPQ